MRKTKFIFPKTWYIKKWHNVIFMLFFIVLFDNSCTVLKPYERVYVDDPEMKTGAEPDKSFEYYFEAIREGSVTATGQKGSGGCGCN